jgi:hypothetical protein
MPVPSFCLLSKQACRKLWTGKASGLMGRHVAPANGPDASKGGAVRERDRFSGFVRSTERKRFPLHYARKYGLGGQIHWCPWIYSYLSGLVEPTPRRCVALCPPAKWHAAAHAHNMHAQLEFTGRVRAHDQSCFSRTLYFIHRGWFIPIGQCLYFFGMNNNNT